MKLSQIILEEYQKQIKAVSGEGDFLRALAEGLKLFTQAYKDALYMEGQVRGSEEDRQVHLYDIMNDFMVRNNLGGSEAVEPVDEHMKQFQDMTLAELEGIASKVEHPTKKAKSCQHEHEDNIGELDTQYKCRKCGETIFKIDFDWVKFKK